MKIRSQQEIQSLDAELNLFEEDKWDFMAVLDNQDTNYEYFNDIRDTDFSKRNKKNFFKDILPIVAMLAIIITCGAVMVNISGIFEDEKSQYESLANSNQGVYINRVEGEAGSSSDLIEVSSVLSNYFGILGSKSDYTSMHNLCINNSNYCDTYYNFTDSIITLYDTNDCKARLLREFGGLCSVSKINEIIIKDNKYYCYVTLYLPTDSAVHEYTYLNSYDFTQKFSNSEVSESVLIQYLLELMGKTPFTCGVAEVCIEMERDSVGSLMISDDKFITDICLSAYDKALSNIANILGSNLNN